MYAPGVIQGGFSVMGAGRSRVLTGPTPRLTAPMTSTAAAFNPGTITVPTLSGSMVPPATVSGELIASAADARPGGAPFPVIKSFLIRMEQDDPLCEHKSSGSRNCVLHKGQLLIIHPDTVGGEKVQTGISRREKGFLAQSALAEEQVDDLLSGENAEWYMAIVAEEVVFQKDSVFPVSFIIEHTATIGTQNMKPTDAAEWHAGTALFCGVILEEPDYNPLGYTKGNFAVLNSNQAITNIREEGGSFMPCRTAIVTVCDSKERMQICLTADTFDDI